MLKAYKFKYLKRRKKATFGSLNHKKLYRRAYGISALKVRKAYGVCVRRKKVWLRHTSCGFTAYATVKEIGIPHLYMWRERMSTSMVVARAKLIEGNNYGINV